MDFTFTEDQLLYRDNVRVFLQNEVTPDRIREAWSTETGRDQALWQQLVDHGLSSIMVPEAYGGMGMNELDFILLALECGRVALAEPLVETALVITPLLVSLIEIDPQLESRCAPLLEQLASGDIKMAIGHGVNDLVADAHIADWLLMCSGDQIHLLGQDNAKLVAEHSIDPSRRLFAVEWRDNDSSCLIKGVDGIALQAVSLNRGALGGTAQMLGLAEAMMSMTVQYTRDRHQFGRAIGANQALKHALADCAVRAEFAKAPLYRAAYTINASPAQADFAVSQAKVQASGAALLAAKKCIQAHGAMGYTWECDLHIFMKRAWVLDKYWGHNGFHKNRLHQWLLNPHAKIGADKTFGVQL